jgi:hypothetical protein
VLILFYKLKKNTIMKNTTKWIATTITVAAIFFSVNVKAQTIAPGQVGFSVGLEAGAPTGNAHTYLSSFELGGTARFQVGLSSNLAFIVTSGYYNMFDKNITINGVGSQAPGLGIVPVKGGLKGFLGKGVYFTAEGGAGFETSKDDNTDQKDTKAIIAGGLGYETKSWDLGVRYESFMGQNFDYGLVGLRLAYKL